MITRTKPPTTKENPVDTQQQMKPTDAGAQTAWNEQRAKQQEIEATLGQKYGQLEHEAVRLRQLLSEVEKELQNARDAFTQAMAAPNAALAGLAMLCDSQGMERPKDPRPEQQNRPASVCELEHCRQAIHLAADGVWVHTLSGQSLCDPGSPISSEATPPAAGQPAEQRPAPQPQPQAEREQERSRRR